MKTSDNPEQLLSHLRELVAEAEDMVGGRTRNRLGELRHRLSDAQARLQDVYAQSRDKVVKGARYTDETIRSHPYETLGIAVGFGLLAGLLLRRGR